MTNVRDASRELFSRPPDERFETLTTLYEYCDELRQRSRHTKEPSTEFRPVLHEGRLAVRVNGHAPRFLNNWSFTQLCSFAGAAKETVNRLCPDTAARVLTETLADRGNAQVDLQALLLDDTMIRAVNGARYRRLWNAEIVEMLVGAAMGFEPPPRGFNGATGLYAGEQDMFVFMIDPNGWIDVRGEAFAPGFFVWNSEVGKRSVGVSTFWFQRCCANHILLDATEIVELTRRHVGNVHESLGVIRCVIEDLVRQRDARKDQFAAVIAKAMRAVLGPTAPDVEDTLVRLGFTKALGKRATEIAREKGSLTIWSVVDALTQLAREYSFAGSRTEADQRAASLLSLVA